ncbi:hypothetical protein CMO83_02105 [Candidatus Woesearchaeota archaeon]|nr:hypothetical protein [Candidatus Woesearchaeota archaeon]|tara:strand:+ start:6014 stop:6700 length:687 start_codon:yes stop_codon:yes gene_type:complete
MFKNKRAFTLEETVTLILVAIILVFSAKFLYPFFAPSEVKDIKSLPDFEDNLLPAIDRLLSSDNELDYEKVKIFLGSDKNIVGYNKNWDPNRRLELTGLDTVKPRSCADKACLCFYKGNILRGNPPFKPCENYGKVTFFLKDPSFGSASGNTLYGNSIYPDTLPNFIVNDEYKLLILSGGLFRDKDKTIYIEKYEDEEGIVIYFAPVNDATREKINTRTSYIDRTNRK